MSEANAETMAGLRGAFANPQLRRVQLALAASAIAVGAYAVTVLVVAFEASGATGTALALAGQQIPSAIAAPFLSLAADRFPRSRVLVAVDLLRLAGCAALVALIAADSGLAPIIVTASVMSIIFTTYAPATRALLPTLARSPEELTAANGVVSGLDNAALLIGPALGAGVAAALSPEWVFVGAAVLFAWSAMLVARVESARPEPEEDAGGLGRRLVAGLVVVAKTPSLRLLVSLFAAQVLVAGFLNVALFELAHGELDLGDSGVGYLLSALGAGGIAGGLAAAGLAGRRRLTGMLALGLLGWGAGLALMGAVTVAAVAFVAAVIVGFADVWVDVGIVTLIQRITPDEVLGRVFGVLQSALFAMAGLGALIGTAVIEGVGVEAALVAAGGLLPLTVAVAWRRLRALDDVAPPDPDRIALLRGLAIFAPLRAPELEALADGLQARTAEPGEVVIRAGDPGDVYLIVAEGSLEVSADGRRLRELVVGDGFGEIALLHSTPRTATVTALEETRLLALGRDAFLSAVGSEPASAAAARTIAAARLAHGRARLFTP